MMKLFEKKNIYPAKLCMCAMLALAIAWAWRCGLYFNTFAYDDGYLADRFESLTNGKGVLLTENYDFLNLDLASSGEMRFYGLSKVIHVIVYFALKHHSGLYQFLMCLIHSLSSAILCKLLKFFKFDSQTIFVSVVFWVISPFVTAQCFHHFTYLCLPVYLIMSFILYNLYHFDDNISIRDLLLIFCCIFTGENTIPLLMILLLGTIVYSLYTKRSSGKHDRI